MEHWPLKILTPLTWFLVSFLTLKIASGSIYDGICADEYSTKKGYSNVPFIGGVHCYNNGSGICKAFSGRFEFYFNSFKDEMIGPVEASKHVDSYGYHERVPAAYRHNGSLIFHDEAINWASNLEKTYSDARTSLLNFNMFQWCNYVGNYWPYNSVIHKGDSLIYFYNRQSCIYNLKSRKFQHFNTRFTHNTSLRIDLDQSPLLFAMEDNVGGGIRLVKNRRQHWYEVKFEIVENATPDLEYFGKLDPSETLPCRINSTSGPILSQNAYKKFSDIVLTDKYTHRVDGSKDGHVMTPGCANEFFEVADAPPPLWDRGRQVYEVGLHNTPRHPQDVESFYGHVFVGNNEYQIFASGGYTFHATTTYTIPNKTEPDTVEVITISAQYKDVTTVNMYDQFYPMPKLSYYQAKMTLDPEKNTARWTNNRRSDPLADSVKNLNYPDDIAYLHQCGTVLIILGPLYSEAPPTDLLRPNKIASIKRLGLDELVTAFFAEPTDNKIWVYHRLNYLEQLTYTCAKPDSGELVTAVKTTGSYSHNKGVGGQNFGGSPNDLKWLWYDEKFFQDLGVFKGSIGSPEAPDVSKYSLGQAEVTGPQDDNTKYIYIIAGIAMLLILIMCLLCMATMRRRRKSREREAKTTRSYLKSTNDPATFRSGLGSRATARPSARSGLSDISKRTSPSTRSALSGISKQASPTIRSSRVAAGSQNQSTATTRSSSLSTKTADIKTAATMPSSPRVSSSKHPRSVSGKNSFSFKSPSKSSSRSTSSRRNSASGSSSSKRSSGKH